MRIKVDIKGKYREGIEAALKEIHEHGFDSIWIDDQKIRSATITIHIEPDSIVYVTYEKDVYTDPLMAILEGKENE